MTSLKEGLMSFLTKQICPVREASKKLHILRQCLGGGGIKDKLNLNKHFESSQKLLKTNICKYSLKDYF